MYYNTTIIHTPSTTAKFYGIAIYMIYIYMVYMVREP